MRADVNFWFGKDHNELLTNIMAFNSGDKQFVNLTIKTKADYDSKAEEAGCSLDLVFQSEEVIDLLIERLIVAKRELMTAKATTL